MNITEFALYAGVSKAAVSRYFNNGYLSKEKKSLIEKAIGETGYSPNLQAQTIRTKKTRLVGVILPKLSSESCSRMTEGISEILNAEGYELLLVNTGNDPEKEIEYLELFSEAGMVDGVIFLASIFTPAHKAALADMKLPVVIVGQEYNGYDCVSHDDYGAAFALTTLMMGKGRKRPAYIGVTLKDKACGFDREAGFKAAVSSCGATLVQDFEITGDFSMDAGYEGAAEIFEKADMCDIERPDCLFCATDSIALGAMQYCIERKIKIPTDLMIASIGDNKTGKVAAFPLTTAHLHYTTCGRDAADMLLNRIVRTSTVPHTLKLGYEIIERTTTAIN